jgi:hypothetical protein
MNEENEANPRDDPQPSKKKKERIIPLKEVKKEILGCKDPYHILKR